MVGNFSLPNEYIRNCEDGFVYCLSTWSNDVTTGAFWIMALISFLVIIFLATARLGSNRAFGFASFVSLLGGVWLAILKLIPWWAGSTFIIIGLIGLVVLIISEK